MKQAPSRPSRPRVGEFETFTHEKAMAEHMLARRLETRSRCNVGAPAHPIRGSLGINRSVDRAERKALRRGLPSSLAALWSPAHPHKARDHGLPWRAKSINGGRNCFGDSLRTQGAGSRRCPYYCFYRLQHSVPSLFVFKRLQAWALRRSTARGRPHDISVSLVLAGCRLGVWCQHVRWEPCQWVSCVWLQRPYARPLRWLVHRELTNTVDASHQ